MLLQWYFAFLRRLRDLKSVWLSQFLDFSGKIDWIKWFWLFYFSCIETHSGRTNCGFVRTASRNPHFTGKDYWYPFSFQFLHTHKNSINIYLTNAYVFFPKQSLDGFALALAADGRFLYISETVSIYLGLSQVNKLIANIHFGLVIHFWAVKYLWNILHIW